MGEEVKRKIEPTKNAQSGIGGGRPSPSCGFGTRRVQIWSAAFDARWRQPSPQFTFHLLILLLDSQFRLIRATSCVSHRHRCRARAALGEAVEQQRELGLFSTMCARSAVG